MKKISLISATVLSSVAFMTTPVATVFANDSATTAVTSEAVEHFVLTVMVNDKVEQVSEYDLTYTNFLSHLGATSEAKVAEGLTPGEVVYDGNNVTLKFTGERKSAEAPKVETKEVKKEDFVIVLKVDGKQVQESKFDQITYDEFLPHLTALVEANAGEGLKHDSIDYDGNKVTVSFSTVKKETPKTETKPTTTKPSETTTTTTTTTTVAPKTETKPATTTTAETKKTETKSLPKTGDASIISTVLGSLVGVAGLVGVVKKRK